MRKLAITLLAVATLAACKPSKKEAKQETTTEQTSKVGAYQLDGETVVANWIGYKFTNKTGVKGQMQTVNVSNNKSAATLQEALQGVEFSIPVSSLYSNNEIRDNKLKTIFFGAMENTELLSGTVTQVTDNSGVIALKMNNVIQNLPFTLDVQNKTAYLKSTLALKNWNADKAYNAIHKACEFLHTGEDGISKTWDTVDLDIVLNF